VDRGGSQTLETVEHEGHRLLREALESNHCYVLDALNEVYVWQGRTSATPARRAALKLAREVHAKRARAPWARIARVMDGSESILFKEKFSNWPDTLPIQLASTPRGNIAGTLLPYTSSFAAIYLSITLLLPRYFIGSHYPLQLLQELQNRKLM
jgi:hypothetical protein